MYFPTVEDNGNSRSMISTWLGYNHNYRTSDGEFYDMRNLTSDHYPLLATRDVRPLLKECEKKNGSYTEKYTGLIYTDGRITYLKGTTLYYDKTEYDLSDYMEEQNQWQTLIRMGAYIVIFPAGVYVNLHDDSDKGLIAQTATSVAGQTTTYSICDVNGDAINPTISDLAPTEPQNGDFWLNTTEGQIGLNIWYANLSMWKPVATTYVKISVPGAHLTDYFNVDDVVFINSKFKEFNNGSIIKALGDDYMVIIGLLSGNPDDWHQETQLVVERRLPQLDYVCMDKNRLWGCRYGYADGEMVNEIYSSKLGDFKNWYSYQGIATDSYAVSVGVPGEWTGCISYQGYPTFFKDNAIFRIYGSYPAEYHLYQSDVRGVQKGSERSLAIVDEYLVYKSASDVCVYDGSSPVSISEQLGKEVNFYNAVGGGCLNKYRLSMQDSGGNYYHFVYDFKYKIWEREDELKIRMFSASENGQIYAATDNQIYGLGNTDNIAYLERLVGEEDVNWWAETGDMGYEHPDHKYVEKITIRAYIPHRSGLYVDISYDGKPFERVATVRGNSDVASNSINLYPYRCDHFKIRMGGQGECRIYSMATTLDVESEENGYTHR